MVTLQMKIHGELKDFIARKIATQPPRFLQKQIIITSYWDLGSAVMSLSVFLDKNVLTLWQLWWILPIVCGRALMVLTIRSAARFKME